MLRCLLLFLFCFVLFCFVLLCFVSCFVFNENDSRTTCGGAKGERKVVCFFQLPQALLEVGENLRATFDVVLDDVDGIHFERMTERMAELTNCLEERHLGRGTDG